VNRYFSEEQVTDWVAASCGRQGLPVKVSDRVTLAKVAAALGLGQAKGKKRAA
jgi:hypothetical protein